MKKGNVNGVGWLAGSFAISLMTQVALGNLSVVATTSDLAAIGKAIGGEQVEIVVLAKATEDPHFVDARPSFIVKLNRADVLIEGGADLEIGWLTALLDQARNKKLVSGSSAVIKASEGIQLVQVPTTLDRSRGDIHAHGNPHFTTDPLAVRIVARHVANVFSGLDNGNAAYYKASLQRFEELLDEKLQQWTKRLEPWRGQHVVAYHNSWPYFANRFDLKIDVFLEPKPGIPPSPAHLAGVIQAIKGNGARIILVEPYVNARAADAVARHTGAKVVKVMPYPQGNSGQVGDYFQWMDGLVKSIEDALGGQG